MFETCQRKALHLGGTFFLDENPLKKKEGSTIKEWKRP
jgi:hypothetical protein